jgi:N-acetylglucosamine-6-phosphate deacetylase
MGGMLLTDARVVTADEVLTDGWLLVADGRIQAAGSDPPPADGGERVTLGGRHLVPGFVDLHVHGGGGRTMQSADPSEIAAAVAFHGEHGTTRCLVSVMSAPLDDMLATVRAAAELTRAGTVLGVHLEGPFLNSERRGAHDMRHLLMPDAAAYERLRDAADGALRVVTLAPELPGGLDLLRRVVADGIVAAVGHSDADHASADAAFEAGATLVTHLYNGMRPWHHRDPGLAGAALAHSGVVSELIVDGVHVHDAAARVAFAAAPGRIALVTDATPAAGAPDGEHRLGPTPVVVRDGAPRLADGDTLAGSVLTMGRAVQRAIRDLGVAPAVAVRAASATPARVLGRDADLGSLAPGARADLVVLDEGYRVEAVMADGVWISSGRLFHT